MRDVLSILPFKNKLVKIEVTGSLLRESLEHGIARIANNAQPGAFPQVSGIQFSYDASRRPGERIVDLKVNGQAVAPDKKYSVTTTTFIAFDGGDGYSMLKGAPVLTPPEQLPLDSDVLRRAFTVRRALAPKVEGRIIRLDKSQASTSECN
jgi:5'-nucleotidase